MIQATETLIEVPLIGVADETVQAWLEAGLECEKWHGRTLTSRRALARFHREHAADFGDNRPDGREPLPAAGDRATNLV